MATKAPAAGAIVLPEATATMPPTPIERIDRVVNELAKKKHEWLSVSLDHRIALLDDAIDATVDVADAWSAMGLAQKKIIPSSPAGGEVYALGPFALVRHLRLLRDTLVSLRDTGEVGLPGEPWTRPDGQVVVPVLPTSKIDNVLFAQTTGEIWLEPHVTLDTMKTGQVYREKPAEGRVCFILGAGNVSSTPAIDATQKLFTEDQVVVLKMNPVNDWAGPFVERALGRMVREGWIQVVYGGIENGKHLTNHPDVDTIHMTGSDKTHDAIVFGTGKEGARNKKANTPILDKEISSELGNVSPWILVPGSWSEKDIDFQANHLASMLALNVGFGCGCPRVIITAADWAQRDEFLNALRHHLAQVPPRYAFYPGARDRWEAFVEAHPEAEIFGPQGDGQAPWTLIPDLDHTNRDDICFRTESWNGVFGEAPLPGEDVATFLANAVEFCNETLWGTLGATIIAHPSSLKDPVVDAAVERAIADLRYGTVGLNVSALNGYGYGSTSWGGFPGHPLNDIQSGRGVVKNSYLIEDVQKSVIRGPFRLSKKPGAAYDFATYAKVLPRVMKAAAYDDWKQIPAIIWLGLQA
ncbi:MAG: aldehyde dehydrogenase family protein [Nitriliruptorales bacterium]|nr:aldehyde dehydrogenase family protein [Nitriliruptorales bacterium]